MISDQGESEFRPMISATSPIVDPERFSSIDPLYDRHKWVIIYEIHRPHWAKVPVSALLIFY